MSKDLKRLIKEELADMMLDETPEEIDWELMAKEARPHVDNLARKIAPMVNEEGSLFVDEMSQRFPYPRQYLLEQLIKHLQGMV